MPSRNILKTYVEGGYYHIYNRGVEKRNIFLDNNDCIVLLRYFKQYLSPKEELKYSIDSGLRCDKLIQSNMFGEVELLAFSLMPNHFHLLVKQITSKGIETFMRRLLTAYVKYFNHKYDRVGPLFQDTYKAALIVEDSYLLHLSKYIHLNPHNLKGKYASFKEFTSFLYYVGKKRASWIKPEFVLEYFTSQGGSFGGTYKQFVQNYNESSKEILGELVIET